MLPGSASPVTRSSVTVTPCTVPARSAAAVTPPLQPALSRQLAPAVSVYSVFSAAASVSRASSLMVTSRVSSGSVPWPSPAFTVMETASCVPAVYATPVPV